eukprot:1159145-Rhodomonas_salina.1
MLAEEEACGVRRSARNKARHLHKPEVVGSQESLTTSQEDGAFGANQKARAVWRFSRQKVSLAVSNLSAVSVKGNGRTHDVKSEYHCMSTASTRAEKMNKAQEKRQAEDMGAQKTPSPPKKKNKVDEPKDKGTRKQHSKQSRLEKRL